MQDGTDPFGSHLPEPESDAWETAEWWASMVRKYGPGNPGEQSMRGIGLGLGLSLRSAVIAPDTYSYANSEAQALVARMTVAPTATRKQQIDTYIGELKASGVWAKRDTMYVLAAHSAQASLLDWKNLGGAGACNLVLDGAPVFNADQGWLGNTLNYLVASAPSYAAGSLQSQNDCHYSCYTLLSSASVYPDVGGVGSSLIQVYTGRNAVGGYTRSTTLLIMSPIATDSPRNICLVRRDSSGQVGFEDGAQTHADTSTSSIAAYYPQIGKGGRRNAIVAGGVSLSNGEVSAAHSADTNFLVAIGAL
jgi:hypothetical protein